jgi:hypothetical protein
MRRRRRGWSDTSDVGKSGRGVIRDFSSHVDMPAYQDRTVAVERALLYKLTRRWAPMALAAAAIVLGPFAGGRYVERRVVSQRSSEARSRLLGQLRREIESAAAGLRTQASVLSAAEAGDLSRADELSVVSQAVAWRAASLPLDALAAHPSYAGITDFYARLASVNQRMSRYLHAVDHARWGGATSGVNAVAVAADAARLRADMQATAAAGESAIQAISALTE